MALYAGQVLERGSQDWIACDWLWLEHRGQGYTVNPCRDPVAEFVASIEVNLDPCGVIWVELEWANRRREVWCYRGDWSGEVTV